MIAFVILHYNTINDTLTCVNSILKHTQKDDIKIVIVDNDSPNNSGEELMAIYDNESNVKVILNSNNLGFSKANNIGCKYVLENYNPEYICVLNNDTYIDDYNFVDKIRIIYENKQFEILGPKIWNTKKMFNHNPMSIVSDISEVTKLIKKTEKAEKILNSNFSILTYPYSRCSKEVTLKNRGVFGAGIIFSKDYLKKYNEVFPEITFMYGEENFLYYRVKRDNLIMVFDNNITIYHNHSSSTRSSHKSIIDTWKFKNKYQLIALKKLEEILIKNKPI